MAPEGALFDPTLQKDINFMQSWFAKAAVNNVSFTEVLSKSKKTYKRLLTKPALGVLPRRLNEFCSLEYSGDWSQ